MDAPRGLLCRVGMKCKSGNKFYQLSVWRILGLGKSHWGHHSSALMRCDAIVILVVLMCSKSRFRVLFVHILKFCAECHCKLSTLKCHCDVLWDELVAAGLYLDVMIASMLFVAFINVNNIVPLFDAVLQVSTFSLLLGVLGNCYSGCVT